MDVDALSIKAREEAMKIGACFGCGEIWHISRNCPKKRGYGQGGRGGNAGQPGQSGTQGKTWTKGKDLLAYICFLTAGLSAEEHEELMKSRVFEAENCLDISVSFSMYSNSFSSVSIE